MTDYLWHTSIEPIAISEMCSYPRQFSFSVCILSWLIEQLQSDPTIQTDHLELGVAFVGELGKYPALVVRFKDRDPSDQELSEVEENLCSQVDQLLAGHSVLELSNFIHQSNRDWSKVTQELQTIYTD